MKIIFSPRCLEYKNPGHPESPERVKICYAVLLTEKDAIKLEFIKPEACKEEDILLAHTGQLLDRVKQGNFFDPDTPAISGIFGYASLSAGAAIKAAQIALDEKEFTFSLMRPPGHHAGRNSLGGFCYFNNIAIAIKKAMDRVKKTAILDLDCHHGNGTEDIFLGISNVLYISLHQSPLYPGTGLASRKNCLNFPLSSGTEERAYLSVLREALKEIKDFKPGLLGISIGFDTYKDDPLANIRLETGSYFKISQMLRELDIPAFGVLEGGYSHGIGECLYYFLSGMQNSGNQPSIKSVKSAEGK